MAKLQLNYVVIGHGSNEDDAGGWFPTTIPIEATVLDLMKQIKAEHPDVEPCPLTELELFLAKKQDGSTWFPFADEDLNNLLNSDAQVVAKYTIKAMKMQRICGLEAYFSREMTEEKLLEEPNIHFFVFMPNGVDFPAHKRSIPVYDIADLSNTHIMQIRNKLDLFYQSGDAELYSMDPEPEDTSIEALRGRQM